MDRNRTSIFTNSLIWFGAAVSIAEILTGTLIAPLGLKMGLIAIITGHVIGCILLYLVGSIGAKARLSSMETVRISFGRRGSILFSSLNVLQLIGWTAVMIVSGAAAANLILNLGNVWKWSIIIGFLIIVWVIIRIKNLSKLNAIAMIALFILSMILSGIVARGNEQFILQGNISFSSAVELSAAMPISWLPLISDYNRSAEKPMPANLAGVITYFVTSSWMYTIGLCAAIFTGQSDVGQIMMSAGLGTAGLMIIVFSTVTTTFLDAYSGGVSASNISILIKEKPAAIAMCVLGTILAIFTPVTQYEHFLYFIGSVFAPMAAIMIADYYILKRDYSSKAYNWKNLLIWAIGFMIYRIMMGLETPAGNTLPAMLITIALSVLADKFKGDKKNA